MPHLAGADGWRMDFGPKDGRECLVPERPRIGDWLIEALKEMIAKHQKVVSGPLVITDDRRDRADAIRQC